MISLLSILHRLVTNLADVGFVTLAALLALGALVASGAGGHLLALVEERTDGSR